jgi:hypothetical protein
MIIVAVRTRDEALSKYQILCANCNQIKRMENREN